MRIAIASDIHGNPHALDAVLSDARSMGVDEFWFVGDFAAIGPEPVEVLESVANMHNARYTRGNTDRYIVTGEGPPPSLDVVRANPDLISRYARIAASFAWTRGYLTAHDWLPWIDRLPLEIRTMTASGARILAVHAAPGTDDGEGVHPGLSNAELHPLFSDCNADVVFVAHTHEPLVRRIEETLVVNLGSVSNPKAPDLRACYVMLEATDSGTQFWHRRVAYDHEAFAESVLRSRHPAADFILSFQRGEHRPHTPHTDHQPYTIGEPVRVDTREGES